MDQRNDDDGRLAYELDRSHVFHSWSAQAALDPLVVRTAHGCEVELADGTVLLDFSSQLVNVNIGYQHPKLVSAIQDQAARLCTISGASAPTMCTASTRSVFASTSSFMRVRSWPPMKACFIGRKSVSKTFR